ncbi:unnamed protein product [Macrosiphum euphorbiae]|uniref:C2H2-type domain-containing protein n=1 Tax=Macrosiphum euphorbiae TaxID=13131 RepID=A0AAV0Y175_9HEMI|nr:unnamed protein product [Macrosiphum euphorbiae]
MFNCGKCPAVFSRKYNLDRHEKTHNAVRLSCPSCILAFSDKSNLARHMKIKHGIARIPTVQHNEEVVPPLHSVSVIQPEPMTVSRIIPDGYIELAPQILVPDTPAGPSSSSQVMRESAILPVRENEQWLDDEASDEICVETMKYVEDAGLCDESGYSNRPGCIQNSDNENNDRGVGDENNGRGAGDENNGRGVGDENNDSEGGDENIESEEGEGDQVMERNGVTYISLPGEIQRKRGTINPQNKDRHCFKWSVLAKHVTGRNRCRIGNNYHQHSEKYDFSGLSFPTPLSEVKIFERKNPSVSINVYGLEQKLNPLLKTKSYIVFPLKVVDKEKEEHIDLLYITKEEKMHYIYISNFSRLIRSQSTGHVASRVFCKRCFTSFDNRELKHRKNGQAGLDEHMIICGSHNAILPVMPKPEDQIKFKSWENTVRHPIVIYADFEALLVKTDESRGNNTTVMHRHKAMSYGFLIKAADNVSKELLDKYMIPTTPVIYRGNVDCEEVAKHFVDAIVDVGRRIEKLLKTNITLIMSDEEEKTHQECKICNLCKRTVFRGEKVRDHDHLTGKFRQTLCSKCNLILQQPKFVPCYLHNLSNYDSNFIISELAYDTKSINVIPNTEEKFISFSKYLSSTFTIRFIDTMRFMASSLESLAENLITPGLDKFRETGKHFAAGDMSLVTRKGVYPYEYTDSWGKLDEESLPGKDEFYSTLKEKAIKDEEYDHAVVVWEHFACKTLGEYSDLYLKIDVLLLADIFENFRDVCMKAYAIDPAFYYTAPGMSFHCMLKKTKIRLQLLSDYEMLLMFEKGIRGGLVQASKRYATANHEKVPDYDAEKEKSWLVYQDCNNLYGYAMSQYMPTDGFKWVKPTLAGLNDLDDTSPIGRIYEVDISYPKEVHDRHNDFPFLPQNATPLGSKVPKLMATLESKKNYIVHYRNLQQAIKNGLIVEKVHRVIQFNQSGWLAEYILLNTNLRKNSKNDFESQFFKLMINAVFGKTLESMRHRLKMEIVVSDRRLQKLINKSTFKHCTSYKENLSAVSLENKIIEFCKPIYIGFAVLDVSKSLMYDYHYEVMQKHYGDKIDLMYTDTDSLVYHIFTDDFYEDLLNYPILLNREAKELERELERVEAEMVAMMEGIGY